MSNRFDDASCASQVMEPRVHEDLVDGIHSKRIYTGPLLVTGQPKAGDLVELAVERTRETTRAVQLVGPTFGPPA